MRGLLIAVEGCDKSGKTTVINTLSNSLLKKYPLKILNFPNRTTLSGILINQHLMAKDVLNPQYLQLLFAANRWEQFNVMKTILLEGKHIILDRYIHSGICYSLANGLDLDWCININKGLIKPDIVIFIDTLPTQDKFKKDEIFENIEFQIKVYKYFIKLRDSTWYSIDSTDTSPESLALKIYNLIKPKLEKSERGPLEMF